ncbi:hypothetical protein BJD99_00985 [Rhodococcus sp. 1163]|uniref:hypothetical protein n=1 Tax=Rhodococcus sp. 1163 TaxID=1905289 RepID=UPI0009FC3D85|nr:hypothetical protein [Rhodococcus sp. 1163]ORI11746.1 hypothetical protein BJD99_00985 [Rhodococcus sp. 1163]
MGSLSDPNDVGAAAIGDTRFYGGERVGPGRWAILDGLGILWTDDRDGVQLSYVDGSDRDAANGLRRALTDACRRGESATAAFDATVREHGNPEVEIGDLKTLLNY